MDVFKAIKGRRSVRKWLKSPVPENVIWEMIDAAQWAPSSCNRQTWKFLMITDEKLRAMIGDSVKGGIPFLKEAPVLVLVMSDIRPYPLGEELSVAWDVGAAVQNMLLAAHALGLGACWCSWHLLDLSREEEIKKMIGIPSYMLLQAAVGVGYPSEEPKAPGRRPLKKILFTNKFSFCDVGKIEPIRCKILSEWYGRIPSTYEEMDEELLGALMRFEGHAIDKLMKPFPAAHRGTIESRARKLEEILEVWKKRKFNVSDPAVEWCVKILKEYKKRVQQKI